MSDAHAGVKYPRLRHHPAGRRTGRRFISGKSLHAVSGGCATLSWAGQAVVQRVAEFAEALTASHWLSPPVHSCAQLQVHSCVWHPRRTLLYDALFIDAPDKASQARLSSQLTCFYHRKLYQLQNVLKR